MRIGTRTEERRQSRHRVEFTIGAIVFVIVVLLCLVVPVLYGYGPNDLVATPFQQPSLQHPFGTDSFGRDVFLRVWVGGRLDLLIAALVVIVSLIFGTLFGIAAGIGRRDRIGSFLMRLVDAIVAFPFLVLVLVLVVVVGQDRSFLFLPPGAPAVIVAVLLIDWTIYARLARAETSTTREREFITAARTLGYSTARIAFRHLLPGVIRVTASFAVADAILVVVTTASLSFLGAGIQAPAAEWGAIMFEGRAVLATSWWVTLFPGVVLAVAGIALGLMADALLEVEQ